ncbi:MAG TPA: hypothetical protein VFY29_15515 [Terriglobia bacterium]|nr:hypothetical protein [Terriglobia bacterium]
MGFTATQKTATWLFVGLTACYLSLSPGTIGGRGYIEEELESGTRMLNIMTAWQKGRPVPPMAWSRHGPIPVLLDLPFIRIGREIVSPDFILSFQPVLLTAGIVTVLFVWLRRLCSPGMSLLLALAAGFGTMLWPYAYIGLETKQSFFLLLAGFMALANGRIERWAHLLFFALISGLALTLKSTGVTLWPAVLFLVLAQFRDGWRSRWPRALAALFLIGFIWLLGSKSQDFYWAPLGGGWANLKGWLTVSPIHSFVTAIGLFGSPTKGLFVFAPATLVAFCAAPRVFRRNPEVLIFAALVLAGTVGFLSLLTYSSDEVWGPRYMHVTVAPLLLCIGAAWPRFSWRRDVPLLVLVVMGGVVSFLGAFYYYGGRGTATGDAIQNTMEAITQDPVWNEVEFSARAFQVWMTAGNDPAPWVPRHLWVWAPPPGAPPEPQALDLRKYSLPQSALLRFWNSDETGITRALTRFYAASLLVGLVALLIAVVRTLREPDFGELALALAAVGDAEPARSKGGL